MLVREAMTKPAVTVGQDDTVRTAAEVLLGQRIASAPVLAGDGRLVGLVSEADLLRGRTQPDPRAHLRPAAGQPVPAPPTLVRDVMVASVVTVHPEDDVDAAARLLLDHGIKMVPVVDSDRVVGVVARRDLLRTLARADQDVCRDVKDLLAELGQGGGWDVVVRDGVVTLHGAPTRADQRVAAVLARTVPGVVRVVRVGACTPFG